jgi:solute carrier family 25 (mitochondrial citrate transporter), member 1
LGLNTPCLADFNALLSFQVRLIADLNRPNGRQYRGLVHATSEILRSEGTSGLYRGAVPTVGKIIFNVAFRFVLYDHIVGVLDQWEKRSAVTGEQWRASAALSSWRADATSLVAGGLAGAMTVLANHPIDVVKSHMQVR